MCDQRERLIGYVYDECEPAERAAVQEHLESCAECRTEIGALRLVREDLQSWEVPDHESVWRPFAPTPAPSWWNVVPRWAVAAAAGVVLTSGAVGGAASYVLLRGTPVVAAGEAGTRGAVTTDDVSALERRLEARINAEVAQLNARVQLASSRPVSPVSEADRHAIFERQLAELRAMNDQQVDVIKAIYNNLGQIQKGFDARHDVLKARVGNLAAAIEQGR